MSVQIVNTLDTFSKTGGSSLLTNLMGYWKLNETSGNAVDSSGNGITGTSSNITYDASGKISRCFSFNASSSVVSFGSTDIRPTSALTISAWTKCGTLGAEQWIISNDAYNTNYYGFRITIPTGTNWGFVLSNGAGNDTDQTSYLAAMHDDNWHHICLTWDGSQIYKYSDNTQYDGSTWNYTIAYTGSGTINPFNFGKGLWGSYYDGELDEIGIWSRALSSTEVGWLYNSGSGLTYPFS